MFKIVNGQKIALNKAEIKERKEEQNRSIKKRQDTLYLSMRKANYPSIIDQLDMMYNDKVNNTTTWMDAIKKVKDKYPKP